MCYDLQPSQPEVAISVSSECAFGHKIPKQYTTAFFMSCRTFLKITFSPLFISARQATYLHSEKNLLATRGFSTQYMIREEILLPQEENILM